MTADKFAAVIATPQPIHIQATAASFQHEEQAVEIKTTSTCQLRRIRVCECLPRQTGTLRKCSVKVTRGYSSFNDLTLSIMMLIIIYAFLLYVL